MSDSGKPYGSEYATLYESGIIKFVTTNSGANMAPMETMTKGRIYVTVNKGNDQLKAITYYDQQNKRYKQIDLDHYHKINKQAIKPHTQYGYFHNGKANIPTEKEQRLIDSVNKIWENRHGKS